MPKPLIVHHYHHKPKPAKKKYEYFWKGMGKMALKEAGSIANLAINEAVDIGGRAAHAMVLSEPPKKKRR